MRPAPGIHVYAPGNTGYIPVSVTLTAPAGVQVHAAVYPSGEDYVFGELKETVKVYSRAFQVRQQVVVSRDAAKTAGGSIDDRGLRAIPGVRRPGLLSTRQRAGQHQAADCARAPSVSGLMPGQRPR